MWRRKITTLQTKNDTKKRQRMNKKNRKVTYVWETNIVHLEFGLYHILVWTSHMTADITLLFINNFPRELVAHVSLLLLWFNGNKCIYKVQCLLFMLPTHNIMMSQKGLFWDWQKIKGVYTSIHGHVHSLW